MARSRSGASMIENPASGTRDSAKPPVLVSGNAVPCSHGCGRCVYGGDEIPALAKHLIVLEKLLLLGFRELFPVFLVAVRETQILHPESPG